MTLRARCSYGGRAQELTRASRAVVDAWNEFEGNVEPQLVLNALNEPVNALEGAVAMAEQVEPDEGPMRVFNSAGPGGDAENAETGEITRHGDSLPPIPPGDFECRDSDP